MAYETIMAMNVKDPERYARYRAGMTPILERYGGFFRYDMVVSEVLKSPTTHPITRVFAINFPSKAAREAFYADPEYQKVRAEHFTPAVDGHTAIAVHELP